MQAGIIRLGNMPSIVSSGAIVGKKEHEGPLGKYFGQYDETDEFGMPTWEQSESEMQRLALNQALESGNLTIHDVDAIFAGDLMNQCTSSGYGLANFDAQFFGLFGACSTIIEGISLGSMLVDSGHVVAQLLGGAPVQISDRIWRAASADGAVDSDRRRSFYRRNAQRAAIRR